MTDGTNLVRPAAIPVAKLAMVALSHLEIQEAPPAAEMVIR